MNEAMLQAIELARQSGEEVPVAALVLDEQGNLIAASVNSREKTHDPTAHAEINAIRQAAQIIGDWRLDSCSLVVTLEPCVMCAGAIQAARIPKVIFGAYDELVGAAGSRYDLLRDKALGSQVEVIGGVLEKECAELLESFFQARRG